MESEIIRDKALQDFASMECPVWAVEQWIGGEEGGGWAVDSLWFTAEEAEAYLEATRYNFAEKARVYGYAAKGVLKQLLNMHTIDGRPR